MSDPDPADPIPAAVIEPGWRFLCRLGGAAAFAVLGLIAAQIVVFILWPPPEGVVEWFRLFDEKPLVGLLNLDLLMIVDYALLAVMYLALWVTVWRSEPSLATIGAVLQMLGTASYVASTVAFEMLRLSQRYSAATSDAGRSAIAEAGELLLAMWQGTAYNVSYVLSAVAMIAMSSAMLRSGIFGRHSAYAGIAAGLLATVPPTVGPVGMVLAFLSLIPMAVWQALTGLGLLRIAATGLHDRSRKGLS